MSKYLLVSLLLLSTSAIADDKVCDYQNQCYSTNSTPHTSNPHTSTQQTTTIADSPSVSAWKNCMSRALGVYYQNHNQQELQIAAEQCQSNLGPITKPIENLPQTRPVMPSIPVENLPQTRPVGRRDIGCGLWPVGSDADLDCESGQFNPNGD